MSSVAAFEREERAFFEDFYHLELAREQFRKLVAVSETGRRRRAFCAASVHLARIIRRGCKRRLFAVGHGSPTAGHVRPGAHAKSTFPGGIYSCVGQDL